MDGEIVADFVGVVLYRRSQDRPNCFLATWYSTRTGEPRLGSGIALGRGGDGYAGVHEIRYYEPNGELAGVPFELTIEPVGEIQEMTWRYDGQVVFRGVGIESGDQLAASYWKVPTTPA